MKALSLHGALLLGICLLAGCEDTDDADAELPTAPPEFRPLTGQEEFRTTIVGKDLAFLNGTLVLNPDGSFGGSFPGGAPEGQWFWSEGAMCRELTIGTERFERDCVRVLIKGDTLRFVREDGSLGPEASLK